MVAVDVGDENEIGLSSELLRAADGIDEDGLAVPAEDESGVVDRIDFDVTILRGDFLGRACCERRDRKQKQRNEFSKMSRLHKEVLTLSIEFATVKGGK